MIVAQWGLVAPLTTNDIPKQERILVYPNPARDMTQVSLTKSGELKIYSLWGKQLLTLMGHKGLNMIDLSHLPEGNYLLAFDNGSNNASKLISIVR